MKQAPSGFKVVNGGTMTVRCATTEAGLSTASVAFTSANFDNIGGMIGFLPERASIRMDDLTMMVIIFDPRSHYP